MIELLTLSIIVFLIYMFAVMAQLVPMLNFALAAFMVAIVLLTVIPLVMIFKLK